jgi:hypothetical protein
VEEICQNRTANKDRFIGGASVAQIKKCNNNKSLEITWDICTRNRRSKRYSDNFHKFLRCSAEMDNNFLKSYLPQIRGSSWHKNEIKMIKRGHYISNNFQDSNKRKSTEKKKFGLSPKSAFL